jgi:DNA-binding transcriptional MerR regulator
LAFIRHARELGFETEAIRAVLALHDNPDHSCEAADAIARARLADVDARIAALSALKAELARMVSGHGNGKVTTCCVIEVLGDHAKGEHHRAENAVASDRPRHG